MIYTFYIFDKHGSCLYYEDWNRKRPISGSAEGEQKLLYGMIWSLKAFVKNTSPFPYGIHYFLTLRDAERSGFHFYKTTAYKLHFFESASNYKFILTTDPETGDMRDILRNIYKNVFVDYVIKNPLYKIGEPINCELFIENLQKEIRGHPAYKSIK